MFSFLYVVYLVIDFYKMLYDNEGLSVSKKRRGRGGGGKELFFEYCEYLSIIIS